MSHSKLKNLIALLQERAVAHPQKTAYIFLKDGENEAAKITYSELDKQARIIGAYLQNKQLFNSRVLLIYPSGLDFIAAFFGCLYAGVIGIPINAPILDEIKKSHTLVNSIIKDAGIAGILTTSAYLPEIKVLSDELSISDKTFISDTTGLDDFIERTYQTPQISDDTIAYLQYTSGSTASPKGTIIQHKNLIHSLKATVKSWNYTKHSVTLNWAPHSHVYGLVVGILTPLYHGTVGILMPTYEFIAKPARWLKAISRYQVTHSGCPNFGYDLCVQEIQDTELWKFNLKTWKTAINGGEKVRHETLIQFSKKFSACGFQLNYFRPTYGMSELTGAISTTQLRRKPTLFKLSLEELANNKVIPAKKDTPYCELVGQGRLLPGIEAVIVNPETLTPAHRGNIGEIWLTGESVAQGYWKKEEETQATFYATLPGSTKKYFKTGDLGFLAKKELCLTGRLKDLIIVHGKKYYPSDLEKTVSDCLKEISVNENSIIFSLPFIEQEQLVFIQELPDVFVESEIHEQAIRIIRKTIEMHSGVDVHCILLVPKNSLPKTSSGKLQRKMCQDYFIENKFEIIKKYLKSQSPLPIDEKKEGDLQSTNLSPTYSINNQFYPDFLQLLSFTLKIEPNQINLNAAISDHGIDSIKMINLVAALNKKYHLNITPDILFEYTTLADFYYELIDKNAETLIQYYQSDTKTPVELENPQEYSTKKDIAIIGMNGVFPQADDLDTFWNNLMTGKSVITEIPKERWDWEKITADSQKDTAYEQPIKWGGFIENIAEFDASFFNISPREAEIMDPQQRIFLQVVWKTIEDAGYSPELLSKFKTGLFVGAFSNDYAERLQEQMIHDPYLTTGITHSILANRISYLLNLHGPSVAIDTACSSSLVAIHQAIQSIQNDDCEMAIAGGVNALLSPSNYLAANSAGMLSEDGSCKVFDKDANGYVRSEGCAAILLKPLNKALTDNDHIYGIIKGTAVNHGGYTNSLTAPNPNAQAEVIANACRRANISIDTINYIETHGTGTSLGDPVEINGLKKAFSLLAEEQGKETLPYHYCGLGALKSHIGHLESAAGIASIIKVLLAMKNKQLPGNLHFSELNPYIKLSETPFYLIEKNQDWYRLKDEYGIDIPLRAGISSFGFGGTNAHIILEESPYASKKILESTQSHYLIPLSAHTENSLREKISGLENFLIQTVNKPTLEEISYTLSTGRKHLKKRCVLIVESLEDLQETLKKVQTGEQPKNFIFNLDEFDLFTNKSAEYDAINQLIHEINKSTLLSELEYFNQLLTLGQFYIEGYAIDFEKLFSNAFIKRISLPTYPFSKESYWIPQKKPIEQEKIPTSEENSIEAVEKRSNEEKFFQLRTHVHQDFKNHISKLLKLDISSIDVTASLDELGFDSITLRELTVELKNYYGINLNPSLFFTYTTIDALSDYLLNTYTDAVELVHSSKTLDNELLGITESPPVSSPTISKNGASNMRAISSENIAERYLSKFEPIAVVGMQGLFPHSKNVNELWKHLQASENLISEVPIERWDWQAYYGDGSNKTNSKWGGFLDGIDQFDAEFFNLSPREVNLMDPQQRLFLETVWRTIEDAGYDPFSLSNQNVGIFVGAEFNEYTQMIAEQGKMFHGFIATGNSHSILANRISYFLNLHGPSEVIDTACSSSSVAIHHAINSIRNGECTTAIAGGVSLNLDPKTFVITSQLGILSPDGACKTFDKAANGYVKGEGVGAILLKPLRQAQKDGDHIYGVIKSTAVKHGGKSQSLTAPNAYTQTELLIQAYTEAATPAETITYIEAHGTGTELGDPVEVEGLKQAFHHLLSQSDNPTSEKYCALGSIKTSIGHLEPASGIAGVIKVLLAMQHEHIPSNLHFNELNPYIELENSPFYIADKFNYWTRLKDAVGNEIPRRAGVSSFGFGGTIAHTVIEEAPPFEEKTSLKPYYLVTLSAKQEESLKQKFIDLHEWLIENPTKTNLSALSFTLNAGRSHFPVRCAMVVCSIEELTNTLKNLIDETPSGNYFKKTISIDDDKGPVFLEIYRTTIEAIANTNLSSETYRNKLLLLADLYTKNFLFDWNLFHTGEKHQRVATLPNYPFIKKRFWFDAELPPQFFSEPVQPETASEPKNVTTTFPLDLKNLTLAYLKKIFSEKINLAPEKIAINTTYEMYGIDSILVLEITNRLENDFGALPKTLLYEKNQLNDLASYLQKNFHHTLEQMFSYDSKNTIEMVPEKTPVSPQQNFSENFTFKEKTNIEHEDIAIIGLSGTYPMAKNIDEFWANLAKGQDCISEVPVERWNYKDYPILVNGEEKYYPYGGFIPDIDKFDPLFFNIAPRDAALMDPQERLFIESAWTTLEDAGYTREQLQEKANNSVGVFVGATYNFYPLFIAEEWAKGNRMPLDIQMFSIANRVSYFLNLNGPSYVVDTACSSSMSAIHLAYESVLNNECVMAIAGGVNLSLHPCKYHMLGSYGFLSAQGRCTSFAAGGNGYVPSEGVGSILLKKLSQAMQDKDRIYGVIKSSSMNHGGKTSGYTVPSPNAQANLIKDALKKAQINPRTISYIEAHGTGTSLGDPIEIRGLQEAFEEHTKEKHFCAIGSVKSNIGHLEAAAGISQLTKVLLQMQHKKLVPSLHAQNTNPYIDFPNTPFFVQQNFSEWETPEATPRRAGISSFGAGGTNVHLIIEEFIEPTQNESHKMQISAEKPGIFLLSALNADRLSDYAQKIYTFLNEKGKNYLSEDALNEWLANLCYTSQVGRENMTARLAILTTSYQSLLENLKAYIEQSQQNHKKLWFNHIAPLDSTENLSEEIFIDLIKNSQYEKIIEYWMNHFTIPWQAGYLNNQQPKRIFFPTYPFAKRRCWVSSEEPQTKPIKLANLMSQQSQNEAIENRVEELIKLPEFAKDWLYKVHWEEKPSENKDFIKNELDHWIIFCDESLGKTLQETLKNHTCTYCFPGTQFEQNNKNTFYINPTSQKDYAQFMNYLFETRNSNLTTLIYFASFEEASSEINNKLLYLLQTITKYQWQHTLQFCLITQGGQSVDQTESIQIWQHYLWPMIRIFSAEHAKYLFLLLDLDIKKSLSDQMSLVLHEISTFQPGENHIAYREEVRHVARLAYVLEKHQDAIRSWHAPKTALITGGLGALGEEIAQWLVSEGTQYLLLIGTTELPDRAKWLDTQQTSLKQKIAAITRLEKRGVTVKYVSVDVVDPSKMQLVIRQTEQEWKKPIQGVFHLAGITTDNLSIEAMSEEIFHAVLSTKIKGALVLHELFKHTDLNCFVLFSSIAALPYFGMRGLSAYAAANAFLDGLACLRHSQGLPATSINWAAWADKGMSFKYNHSAFLETMGMSILSPTEGIELLKSILMIQAINVGVFKIDWVKFLQVNSDAKKLPFFAHFSHQLPEENNKKIQTFLDPEKIHQHVIQTFAQCLDLQIDEIEPSTPFQNYGLDSIIGIQFVSKLSEYFPDTLSPMDLYRYPTINQLSTYIAQMYQPTDTQEATTDLTFLEEIANLKEEEVSKLIEEELIELEEIV